jgi:hypothetical protein
MLNQEAEVFKKIIVKAKNDGVESSMEAYVQKALVKHYRIVPHDGIRCVLEKKSKDIKNLKNAEKINQEILLDVGLYNNLVISSITCELYDIKSGDYLCLSIQEIIK